MMKSLEQQIILYNTAMFSFPLLFLKENHFDFICRDKIIEKLSFSFLCLSAPSLVMICSYQKESEAEDMDEADDDNY